MGMIGFNYLAKDVRFLIYDALISENNGNDASRRKVGFSNYSRVCREWRSFFEKHLYGRLTLTQHDLVAFGDLTLEHRKLTKMSAARRNDGLVLEAVYHILSVLNGWEAEERESPPQRAVTLEVGAYAASDIEHEFQGDVYLDSDGFALWEPGSRHSSPNHRDHGWPGGRRVARPGARNLPQFSIREFARGFPEVAVVRRLIIRRQNRRHVDAQIVGCMVMSLPNLVCLQYEPRRQILSFPNHGVEYSQDRTIHKYILPPVSDNLQELAIFEDFNEDNNAVCRSEERVWVETTPTQYIRPPCRLTASALARKSRSLKKLSASHFVDGKDFFRACHSTWTWERLEHLAITSQSLSGNKDHETVTRELMDAAAVALRMPKLLNLEIWHGRRGKAALFRYLVTPSSASVGWRGTWELELQPELVTAWQAVASMHTRHELFVQESQVLRVDIASHAAAIRALQLSDHVVHQASLEEMERESSWCY